MTEKFDQPALRARAERYRELAAQVLQLKDRTRSQEVHAACINLAAGWKSLADKIETTLDGIAPPEGAGGSNGAGTGGENLQKRAAGDQ